MHDVNIRSSNGTLARSTKADGMTGTTCLLVWVEEMIDSAYHSIKKIILSNVSNR